MRKKKGTIPEKEHQNQTLSSRAEKAMTKKKNSGCSIRRMVELRGIEQQIDQHKQLSGNGNDGFLLAELVMVGPEPVMERRITYLHSRPGRLAQNSFNIRISMKSFSGLNFSRALVIPRRYPCPTAKLLGG